MTRPSSVVMWGFRSRADIDAAARGRRARRKTTSASVHSWDPPDPDGLLDSWQTQGASSVSSRIRVRLRSRSGPGWIGGHITRASPCRSASGVDCHNVVIPASSRRAERGGRRRGCRSPSTWPTRTPTAAASTRARSPRSGAPPAGICPVTRWGVAIDMNTIENPEGAPAHDELRRRAHLPQVGLRVGRQLPPGRRHALRVRGRAAGPDGPTRRGTAPNIVDGRRPACLSVGASDGATRARRLLALSPTRATTLAWRRGHSAS